MEISRHARNNMRLYKISEGDILGVLASPDVSTEEDDKRVALKAFRNRYSGYPVKVVYEEIAGNLFIITAYPLKKKMWR